MGLFVVSALGWWPSDRTHTCTLHLHNYHAEMVHTCEERLDSQAPECISFIGRAERRPWSTVLAKLRMARFTRTAFTIQFPLALRLRIQTLRRYLEAALSKEIKRAYADEFLRPLSAMICTQDSPA